MNTALDRDQREQSKPSGPVRIAFPLLARGAAETTLEAKVEAWLPPPPRPGAPGDDVAGLVIEGDPPDGVTPGTLASGSPGPGTTLRVYGIPPDRPYGAWAKATMRGTVAMGRLHLDPAPDSAWQAEPGFSGGPVIDPLDRIVALVSESAGSKNDSYPIGLEVLRRAWPGVLETRGRDRKRRILLAGGAIAVAAAIAASLSYPLTGATEISSITVGNFPDAVAVDPASHTAYVTTWHNDSVSVINTETNAVTATVPVGNLPTSIAADPAARAVYVANEKDDTVQAIGTATNAVTTTIPAGDESAFIAVDPAAHAAYVANVGGNSVSVINTDTNAVTATVPVGRVPAFVAVDPAAHAAYVANTADNSVSVINTETNAVATVPIGISPFALAVDPAAHAAYITNAGGNSVLVMNTATNTVTATIAVGNFPASVAVDQATRTAYVVNTRDDSVSVINTETNAVTATVRVGSQPHAVAVDPATHTAYVTNSGDGSVSIVRARS